MLIQLLENVMYILWRNLCRVLKEKKMHYLNERMYHLKPIFFKSVCFALDYIRTVKHKDQMRTLAHNS